MLIEAIGDPLRYRLKTGEEITLNPGVPMDVPDKAARQLLRRAPDKVRVAAVEPPPVVIEPAAPNARPVYWENADGVILGPAVPEFLAQVGDRFWVVVQHDNVPRWIRSDRLRNKQAFETQTKPIPFVRIQEPT